MRGKLLCYLRAKLIVRISPACAGKTTLIKISGETPKDHPRVCGENRSLLFQLALCVGSPPRVRGKLLYSYGVNNCVRITPACAGKTLTKDNAPIKEKDHPRVCGENIM